MPHYGSMTRTANTRSRRQTRRAPAAAREMAVVPQFSTRLPSDLLERLRIAAPRVGMRRFEFAGAGPHAFLSEQGD